MIEVDPKRFLTYYKDLQNREDQLKEAELKALLLFGSRARGNARKNSDIDLLTIVEPNQIEEEKFAYHHRGTVTLDDGEFELEMPISSLNSLSRAIDEGHPILSPIVADSLVIFEDPIGLTRGLKEKARTVVAKAISDIEKSLSAGDYKNELALCRVEYRDLRNITRAALARGSLASLARITEALSSFYEDMLTLLALRTSDLQEIHHLAKQLYYARRIKVQRYLDNERYEVADWYGQLLNELKSILEEPLSSSHIDFIFAQMNKTSTSLLGTSITANEGENISALAKR